jgi:cyclase
MMPRVIPCVLLQGSRMVKTVGFRNPVYLGDVINAVRIFNDRGVDELLVLDTQAHRHPGSIQWPLVEQLAAECFMPVCYGGGIRNILEVQRLLRLGFEKVAITSAALEDLGLVERAARDHGCQSVVVGLEVTRTRFGRWRLSSHGGTRRDRRTPLEFARAAVAAGAGELLVQSVDRDGTGSGYDVDLVREISAHVEVPVIACGGAGSLQDVARVIHQGGASAAAAGSLFVFHGPHRAVLIHYPERKELDALLGQ